VKIDIERKRREKMKVRGSEAKENK